MGVSRDLNGMIRKLVWLQENVNYLQEYSIIIATDKSKHNDIENVILDGGEN